MKLREQVKSVGILILLAAVLVLAIKYSENVIAMLVGLWHVVFPLALGLVIAYILNIILRMLERRYFPASRNALLNRVRRPVCILLSILLVVAVVSFVILLVVPKLVETFTIIGRSIPFLLQQIIDYIVANGDKYPSMDEQVRQLQQMQLDWKSIMERIVEYATAGVGGLLDVTFSVVGTMASALVNTFVALVFAIYLLANKEKLLEQIDILMDTYLKKPHADRIHRVCRVANETFSSYIIGQCTEAVILGLLCMTGMAILRLPYAPMIGAFIGVTALIPIVGAYLGAVVGVLMILPVDPLKALIFVLFIIVLQEAEGKLIYPKVVGSSVHLPGIWVFAAVMVGAGFGGIIGMLFAVPLTATIYKLIIFDVCRRARIGRTEEPEEETAAQENQEEKTE